MQHDHVLIKLNFDLLAPGFQLFEFLGGKNNLSKYHVHFILMIPFTGSLENVTTINNKMWYLHVKLSKPIFC